MTDIELEEGEATIYQYDEATNTDLNALTYIDEKLQNVLGHLKKDFEGGVNSENLGAKYGGYGSFLNQPSPVWSSRSVSNVQENHHKFATFLSSEGGDSSSLSRPNGNHSTKHGPGSIRYASSDVLKTQSGHDSSSVPKFEVLHKVNNMNEEKTLKVRIKVGLDNFSARKNTSTNNGLGLVSQSSSFGDSPIGHEGLAHGFQAPGDESPTNILRIMTSIPNEGHLLSPLPEGLARFTDKLLRGNKVQSVLRHNRDKNILKSNQKKGKKVEDSLKTEERDHLPTNYEEANEKSLNDYNCILSTKDELNPETCEVMASEALKLPFLSGLHGSCRGRRDTSKEKPNLLPNIMGHQQVMPVMNCDGKWDERQIGEDSLIGKVAEKEKVDSHTDGPSYGKKDVQNRGKAANTSGDTNANDFGMKDRMGSITELSSSQKQKNGKKYETVQQEGKKLLSKREKLSSADKKKHKGSQLLVTEATEINKDSIKQAVSGNKDSSTVTGTFPKQEDAITARDKNMDYCEAMMFEDRDYLMSSSIEPSNGRLSTSQNCYQVLSPNNNSKERSDNGAHEQLISKVVSKRALLYTPPSGHVPPIGSPASAGPLVNNWVQCDQCLKWRLLPFGTQVHSFPDDWLCNMLNWLPGMNNCSISQEETTKAVTELYQPRNTIGLHDSPNNVPGVTAPTDMNLSQTRPDIIPGGGKKYHGLKLLLSVKSTSLNNTAEYDVKNEMHSQNIRHSNNPVPEIIQNKKKTKKRKRNSCPDRGHSKYTRQGEPYQDYPRPKKMKNEDEDLMSTHDVGNAALMYDSSNEVLTIHTSSSQSSKGHSDNCLQESTQKSKFQVQAFPHTVLNTRNSDGNVHTKTRKEKSSIDAASHSILSNDMVRESEKMRQKKARMSSLEEKPMSSTQGDSRIEKRRKSSNNPEMGKDVGSTFFLDDENSLKRESGSGAAFSSSKIMDSEKSKFSLREVKSSLVKSLSLSSFSNRSMDMHALGHTAGIQTKDGSEILADREDYNGVGRCDPMRKSLCGNKDHQFVHDLKDHIDDRLVDEKDEIRHSLDVSSHTLAGNQDGAFGKYNDYTSEAPSDDGFRKYPVKNACNDQTNCSFPEQSAAKISSLLKDANQMYKPKWDNRKVKISYDDSLDYPHTIRDKTKDIKIKFQEKSETNAVDFGSRKKPSGIILDSATKENSETKSVGQEGSTFKADSKKQVETKCSKKVSKSADQLKKEEIELLCRKEKPVHDGDLSNHVSLPDQGNGADASCPSVLDRGKSLKEHSSTKIPDIQNGPHSSTSKQELSNMHRFKDQDTLNPMRRDSRNQPASNALKEAKDLKHLADRKKNTGSAESTGLYFEAALKFLHGASLLESSGSGNSMRGNIIHSMQIYSSTAKLCEFCAHEYEKSKDFASASLAYKCMEVAYLRVIYSSHPAASRDRHELQTSLQMVPPGESPSSSASDIDSASNPATAKKASQARDGNSSQPAGNHVIAARSRPIFSRLLNFMQDVNSAMEASRKSQGAFAAAKTTLEQADSKEGTSAVKRVLDFSFHDVNRLLHLVRLGMEAIKH